MQKVSEAPLKKCPHCGKSQLTRLMSAPVFRLKGGGWYETDFKGDKDNQRNLADRPDDTPKDAKDTDTKAKDEKGKDGKDGPDAKSAETKADAASAKESPKATEKPADKPVDKASGSAGKKPASGKRGARSAPPSRRKPVKVKRRR
jgi:hypothetical protein